MKKPKIVAVETSLGTHFLVSACKDATLSDLRGLIQTEHRLCFPEHGKVNIKALKVQYDNKLYHVAESFLVGQLLRRSWNKVHAEVCLGNGKADSGGSQPMQAGSLADERKGSERAAIVDRSILGSREAHQNSYCKDVSAEKSVERMLQRRSSSGVAPPQDDEDEAYGSAKDNTDSRDCSIPERAGYPFFSFETPHTQPSLELNATTLAVLNTEFKRECKKRRGSHGEDPGTVSKKQREGDQCASDVPDKLISMSIKAGEKQRDDRGDATEDLRTRVTVHEGEHGPPNVEEEPKNGDEVLDKDSLSDDLRCLDGLKRIDTQASIEGDTNSSLLTEKEMVAVVGLGKMKLAPKCLHSSQAARVRVGDEVGSMSRSQKTSSRNCDPSESSESTKNNEEEGIIKSNPGKRSHNYHMEDTTKGYPIQLNDHCILLVASLSADVVPETQESDMVTQAGMVPGGGEKKETCKEDILEKMSVDDAMKSKAEKVLETWRGREQPKGMCLAVEEPQLKCGSPRDSNKRVEGSPPLCIDLSPDVELPDAAPRTDKNNSMYRRKKKRRRHKVFKVHDVVDHALDSQGDGGGSKGGTEVQKDNSPENLVEMSIDNHEPFDLHKAMEGSDEPKQLIPSSSQDKRLRPEDDGASTREMERSSLSPEGDEAHRKEMERMMLLPLNKEEVSRRVCDEEDSAEKLKDTTLRKRKKRKKKAIHAVCELNVAVVGAKSVSQNCEKGWAEKHMNEGSRCMEPPYAICAVKKSAGNVGAYVCGKVTQKVARKKLKPKKILLAIEAQHLAFANVHEVNGTSDGNVIEDPDEPKHHIPTSSQDTRPRPEFNEASGKETARSDLSPEDDEASGQEMQKLKLSLEEDESSGRETRRSNPFKGAMGADVEYRIDELVPCLTAQGKLACNEESGAEKLKAVAMKKKKKRKKELMGAVCEKEPAVRAVCDQNLGAGTNVRSLNGESDRADEHVDEGSICMVNIEPTNAVTEVKKGPQRGIRGELPQKEVVVSIENTEAQGEEAIANLLKVDGSSSVLMNTGFVVTSSTNEAIEATSAKDFEVFEFESSKTGEEREEGDSCEQEAKSPPQAEAPDLDQLCSAVVKIVEEDMHNSSATMRRTARKSVHPKRWITVLSERLAWNQYSKSSSKRKSASTRSQPRRKVDLTSGVSYMMGDEAKVGSNHQVDVEPGKIACPAGCGRLYTGKTSAFYRHRQKCAG